MANMRLLILLAISLFTAPLASGARAWNGEGHKIVALIAERHLTPETQSSVQNLLALEGYSSLEQISVWADEVRDLKSPQQPSHALRLPLDDSPFVRKRDCERNLCATAAIAAAVKCLNVCRPSAQLLGLKYLVHLVGDIHQPLHSSADTGQQKVVFQGKAYTLHQIWDGVLIMDRRTNYKVLAALLDEQPPFDGGSLDPVAWAYEGRDIARDNIFPAFRSLPNENGVTYLTDDYAAAHWSVAAERLKLAGLRLGAVLNAAFAAPLSNRR